MSILVASSLVLENAGVGTAVAFDNGLEGRYQDRDPYTGKRPDYLGVTDRTTPLGPDSSYRGLAMCDGRPNCWSSSPPFKAAPARYLDAWDAQGGSIRDVQKVIETYEVGQGGIDGGGLQIIQFDPSSQYLYVQFQSYRVGYIDDVEFWYNPEKKLFDVRSASRVGQSDLGVNAKRLEYIGGRLEREFGWKLKRRKNGSLV